MSITRIAFNSSASYSGAWYLSLNPSKLDLHNATGAVMVETLDGAPVSQSPYFDSRPYMFGYSGIRSDYSGFTSMIGTLKTYVDAVKYVNFGTADYAIPTLGWVKVRVKDVAVEVRDGGRLIYDVVVTMVPEA